MGPDLNVQLDVYHAAARLKKSANLQTLNDHDRADFCYDVTKVFRSDGDKHNPVRSMPTPEKKILSKNLTQLEVKWEEKLTKEAVHDIRYLREQHSDNGCLRYA